MTSALPWRSRLRTGVLLLVASCAAHAGRAVGGRPPTDPSDGDRYDPCDTCVVQEDGDDGCPDPDVSLTDACTLSPEQEETLSRVATELVANAHLTSVRVVSGEAACANAVRVALERHGLPSSRIEVATRGTEPSVTFEVGTWDGKRC
jgi:hypothetical protein